MAPFAVMLVDSALLHGTIEDMSLHDHISSSLLCTPDQTMGLPVIRALWRYPVKGLSPDPLRQTLLTPGEGVPGDRAYAIAHGNTPFDPAHPQWMPKQNFVMLESNPSLAALTTHWDEASATLTIERKGHRVAKGSLTTPVGQAMIAEFLSAYLKNGVRGTAHLVSAPGHTFSDHKTKAVSIFSQASLHDLERVAGHPLDPRRFRNNIMIDGVAPWTEFQWIGHEITIGKTRLRVTERIDRGSSTSTNPDTGEVDINIPRTLRSGFGHICFGVYAEVIDGGPIALGDAVQMIAPPAGDAS